MVAGALPRIGVSVALCTCVINLHDGMVAEARLTGFLRNAKQAVVRVLGRRPLREASRHRNVQPVHLTPA
jgi:hypothetical protein